MELKRRIEGHQNSSSGLGVLSEDDLALSSQLFNIKLKVIATSVLVLGDYVRSHSLSL